MADFNGDRFADVLVQNTTATNSVVFANMQNGQNNGYVTATTGLPIDWRASRLKEMGYGVGLWNWPDHDLSKLEKTGASFTIMNGFLRGALADDDGATELLTTARETAQVGKRLGVARLNLHGTALDARGLPVRPVEVVTGAMWLKARDTLCRVADLAEKEGVVFALENLNHAVDHPGVPFARPGLCKHTRFRHPT